MGAKLAYLVFFSILLSLTASEYPQSSNWQYLAFTQQWPSTVCHTEHKKQCRIPSYVTSWTVHGMWPSSSSGSPDYCNKSLAFNTTVIKPIEDQLLVVWPNLFTDQQIYSFWKYEWLKHGTCAVTASLLDTELKYFTEGIKQHNLYNIRKYLETEDIIPDEETTYSMDRIKIAVESNIGKKAVFQCKKATGYNAPLILSVSICLSKELTLIDCPRKGSNCESSVMYLPLRSTDTPKPVFRPVFYVIIVFVLLLLTVIFAWLTFSKRREKLKMYSVLA